ncbi:hypothetical protein EDB19DRAFT_1897677 [Suillus lakei]|nr:hypothetical protein EDB19DRAFT_1897677 [Suillus lakei]
MHSEWKKRRHRATLHHTSRPNSLRKLRTIRYSDVLRFIDVVESDPAIYIMTERVALTFLNDSASSTHGNVHRNAISITPSGEWKLGGFETMGSLMLDVRIWFALNECVIMYQYPLGLLLHAVFNPTHPPPPTGQLPHHLNMAESDGEDHVFFVNNWPVEVCAGLEGFTLSSESDNASLLCTLKESTSSFSPEFVSYRVLPCLASALEFSGASAATNPLIHQFGKNFAPNDYSSALNNDSTIVAPLLSNHILNNDLLRHLTRLQSDQPPSSLTRAFLLVGWASHYVFVPVFNIVLKVHWLVHDQAFKAVELFVKCLEVHTSTMVNLQYIN